MDREVNEECERERARGGSRGRTFTRYTLIKNFLRDVLRLFNDSFGLYRRLRIKRLIKFNRWWITRSTLSTNKIALISKLLCVPILRLWSSILISIVKIVAQGSLNLQQCDLLVNCTVRCVEWKGTVLWDCERYYVIVRSSIREKSCWEKWSIRIL